VKAVIWRIWTALGLDGPPKEDLKANGKPYSQYGKWLDRVQTAGYNKAVAWAEYLERNPRKPDEHKADGKWFGERLDIGLGKGAHTWEWDDNSGTVKPKKITAGPLPISREWSKATEEIADEWLAAAQPGASHDHN